VLGGFGFHLMGRIGHEGTPSMIPTCVQMGFSISHWNHHRYMNQKGDPDCGTFGRFPTVWRRMLFATTHASSACWRDTVRTALGRPLGFDCRFARLNLAFPGPSGTRRTSSSPCWTRSPAWSRSAGR
jgi:hypothetical protein